MMVGSDLIKCMAAVLGSQFDYARAGGLRTGSPGRDATQDFLSCKFVYFGPAPIIIFEP